MANTLDRIERFILEDLPEMQKLALTAALVDRNINEQERALHDFMAAFAGKVADYWADKVAGEDLIHNGPTRQTRTHFKDAGYELKVVKREPARIIKFHARHHELDAS